MPERDTLAAGAPRLPRYETLERLCPGRPVDRIEHIASLCRGKVVLDIGCYDETALAKRGTRHWLHGRVAEVARQVVGVDSSALVPPEGLVTAPNARILRGDGVELDERLLASAAFEIVVAGEFIEHVPDVLRFLARLRSLLPGRELVLSTPNGVSLANTALALIGREAQHPDHLANFTFKILHTLCRRAGLATWEITPYRFYATEMILGSSGAKRTAARAAEVLIRAGERMFPLLSFGYVVKARL